VITNLGWLVDYIVRKKKLCFVDAGKAFHIRITNKKTTTAQTVKDLIDGTAAPDLANALAYLATVLSWEQYTYSSGAKTCRNNSAAID
jgi:hypothetical protein